MTAGPTARGRSAGRLARLTRWAKAIRRDAVALWLAARDPRTLILAKLVAGAVAAYALSPIALLPDVIPILGQLDDLLIVPLGILLAARLMSPALRSEFRAAAEARLDRPRSRGGAIANVVLWIVLCVAAGFALWRNIGGA